MENLKKLITFCFSPTGTSRQQLMAVAKGMGAEETVHHDCTCTSEELPVLNGEEVALFAVPVYGGHVAPLALKRMEQVRGAQTPAVLLVTYGNRHFEGALTELEAFVRERGFVPVAAGAVIGEHSYSNAQHPIAAGRPDAADLALAEEFGRKVADKLRLGGGTAAVDTSVLAARLETPEASLTAFRSFVAEYSKKMQENPVKVYPSGNDDLCTHCGTCVSVCPTQAITTGNETKTDGTRCIRCCACVKECPTGARTFASPFAPALSAHFNMRREPLFIL